MEEKKKQNQSNNQQTVECSKCHKSVLSTNGTQKSTGFVCNECGNRQKKNLVIGAVGGVLAIIALVAWMVVENKQRTGDGFAGVGEIQDSVSVSVSSNDIKFEISATTATGASISTQNPVSNLEDFKHIFMQNVDNAEKEHSNELVIPSISTLFNINTNHFINEGEILVKEFAHAYSKTNKKATLLVEGYTCDLGDDILNENLSKMRAKTVQNILIDAGIPEKMIELKWYGESRYKEFNYSDKSKYRCVILSIQ